MSIFILFFFSSFFFMMCDSGGPSGPGGAGGPGGGLNALAGKRLWVLSNDWGPDGLAVVDIAADTLIHQEDHDSLPLSLAVHSGYAWIGFENGKLLRINTSTFAHMDSCDIGESAQQLASDGVSLFVWDQPSGRAGTLVKIDPAANAVVSRTSIVPDNVNTVHLTLHEGFVYILADNHFGLYKIDPATGEKVDSAALGQSPDDTAGARTWGKYGYGSIVYMGSSAWVQDRYNDVLLHVDLTAMTADQVIHDPWVKASGPSDLLGTGSFLIWVAPAVLDPGQDAFYRFTPPSMAIDKIWDPQEDGVEDSFIAGGYLIVGLNSLSKGLGRIGIVDVQTMAPISEVTGVIGLFPNIVALE